MTGQQVGHMENVITRFNRAFRQKYRDGQARHGGDVWTKPNMIGQALDEVKDLVCYLDALDGQLLELAEALDAGLAGKDAAAILRSMRATDWR
jgi:hypothetical protein